MIENGGAGAPEWVRLRVKKVIWHLRCGSLWKRYHRTECGQEWPADLGESTTAEPDQWCDNCRQLAKQHGVATERFTEKPGTAPEAAGGAVGIPRGTTKKPEPPNESPEQSGLF